MTDALTDEFHETRQDGEIDVIHGTIHHDGWTGFPKGQIDHNDGSWKGTFDGIHNRRTDVCGANHVHLKSRKNKVHDGDGIDIGENVRNVHVLVLRNDDEILLDDVEQFRFPLRAWFGRDWIRVEECGEGLEDEVEWR